MDTVRHLLALLLIAVSLLIPGGSMPAYAMPDHRVVADCPHASASEPAPAKRPAGQLGMPQCCYALPMAAEVVAGARKLVLIPAALFRPRSDTLPAPLVVGPDVPPPRA